MKRNIIEETRKGLFSEISILNEEEKDAVQGV